jgi:anhydro-N-acetylmuramic acid kinase
MHNMKVIGLISGTSTDGIDAAMTEIEGRGFDARLTLLSFMTDPYPPSLRRRILALQQHGTVAELCRLNVELGERFAAAAMRLIRRSGIPKAEVGLIGSHGQTVSHQPRGRHRSTLQIAEPSVIAERTGIVTVADFRPRDLAARGQGAPLTPYLHYVMFRHPRRARLIVNVGGISNVTYLPAGQGPEAVLAFDTGPGNMLADGVIHHVSRGRRRMDRNGGLARRGIVHETLLRRLMAHAFIRKRPPKTTGREAFGAVLIRKLLDGSKGLGLSPADLLATVTRFTADSIAYNHEAFIRPKGAVDEVIVGGGGARNGYLMDCLGRAFDPIPVHSFEDHGLDSKAIEAMAFALLAYQTARGEPNNLPSATGAARPVVMGKIVPGHVPFSIVQDRQTGRETER